MVTIETCATDQHLPDQFKQQSITQQIQHPPRCE